MGDIYLYVGYHEQLRNFEIESWDALPANILRLKLMSSTTGRVSSPLLARAKKSRRSGRVTVPPLAFWANEVLPRDADGGFKTEQGEAAAAAPAAPDDDPRCLLLVLSHDELGVIFDGLADPLQPVVAVALSSTCLGLRTPLLAALEVLKERHTRVVALCRKVGMSCAKLRDAEELIWDNRGLIADDMASLGMILRTNGLPRLKMIDLGFNGFGDAGMHALCATMVAGTLPSLHEVCLTDNDFGPDGAEALAAALSRGAMPALQTLHLTGNAVGKQGAASLTLPLRKMRSLEELRIWDCSLGDEGVASLVDNLGKDDFKALVILDVEVNELTNESCATLLKAIQNGAMPSLVKLLADHGNPSVDLAAWKQVALLEELLWYSEC